MTNYSNEEKTKDNLSEKEAQDNVEPLDEWLQTLSINNTADVEIPDRLIDQVIGQDEALNTAQKAAEQNQNLVLIGPAGTGKSMIAKAMTNFLSKSKFEDVLCYPNNKDERKPKIETAPPGKGKNIGESKKGSKLKEKTKRLWGIFILALIFGFSGLISLWRSNFLILFFGLLSTVMLKIAIGVNFDVLGVFSTEDDKKIQSFNKKKRIKQKSKREFMLASLISALSIIISFWTGNFLLIFFGIFVASMIMIEKNINPLSVQKRSFWDSRKILITPGIIAGSAIIISFYTGNFLTTFMGIIAASMVLIAIRANSGDFSHVKKTNIPKLLKSYNPQEKPPFVDATNHQPDEILGYITSKQLQKNRSQIHQRVRIGDIHKANQGILFMEEINSFDIKTQKSLFKAIQEREYPIKGQIKHGEKFIQTEPIQTNFILVLSANAGSFHKGVYPGLRSIIRSGYEIHVNEYMDDTIENRNKLVQFVSQEIYKNEKSIPHLDKEAIKEVIKEAKQIPSKNGKLTLRLRELAGLVRVAGNLAVERGHRITKKEDVIDAKSARISDEDKKNCPICGQEVLDKWNVCTHCGNEL